MASKRGDYPRELEFATPPSTLRRFFFCGDPDQLAIVLLYSAIWLSVVNWARSVFNSRRTSLPPVLS
eukprot:scaffold23095_cov35-Tisochrysis_lutea.AAC.4